MLRGIAPLHARFWGPRAGAAGGPSSFLTQQRGVSWIDGLVRLCMAPASAPPWFGPVWDGLCRWLAPLPVCVSHGDFRPGNMLFHRSTGAVIFTDWEALSCVPFLWDFTYATVLGQAPAARRAGLSELLAAYLAELAAALRAAGDSAAADALPPQEVCESAVTALCIVIFYYGWALTKMGQAGGPQGNSEADCAAWQERGAAILDRTASPAQASHAAQALGIDARLLEDMRAFLRHPPPSDTASDVLLTQKL